MRNTRCVRRRQVVPPHLMVRAAPWTEAWRHHQMSTFEYLMRLNEAAGRSYRDLAQYPVFPWVLCDYSSPTIDLDDPVVYRDLSRPMGALSHIRR
jgi:hypothetical protein